MSIYLGNTLVAGRNAGGGSSTLAGLTDVSLTSPVSGQVLGYDGTDWVNTNTYSRNIGEIVASTIPLTDAGLHLLDGALISGSGSYSDFVDYIADFYDNSKIQVAFEMPTLTANTTTTEDGDIVCSASAESSSTYAAWKAGTSSGGWRASSTTSGWWQIVFPYELTITDLTFKSASSTTYCAKDCRFYTDSTLTTPIGDAFVGSASANTNTVVTGISSSGIKTNTIYLKIDSSNSTGIGCSQIIITATREVAGDSFITESEWQSTVSTYGVCGKFVYDSVNNTVRLPKYSNKIYTSAISNTAPVVGNGTTLGWTDGTNHSGTLVSGSQGNYAIVARDADYGRPVGQSVTGTASSLAVKTVSITTDPDNSGIIAQLSNITTSLDGYYYIVIATTTRTQIQVDIDEIATDLNSKADVDLTNVSNTSGFRKLTEIYNNGASWYKVYNEYNPSTGTYIGQWCEQGDKITTTGTEAIILLKAYTNTNYCITVAQNGSASSSIARAAITSQSADRFEVRHDASGMIPVYWRACGYIN